ncbi:MAG: ABC transporter permease [Alphaproteobacteria bacterium]
MISIYKISFKNLLRKKTRTALTVIGIAMSSWVLVSLMGFNSGYEKSLSKDIKNMGFQFILTAKGCPYEAATMMLTGGTGLKYLAESIMEDISNQPEIEATTPMLMHAEFNPYQGDAGGITGFLGVDPKSFPRMKPYLEFLQGEWFQSNEAKEVVLGYEVAELEQRQVGDKILIPTRNETLEVVGILKRSGTQDDGTIFVPLKTVQSIFDKNDKLTGIGIRLLPNANTAEFEDKLYKLPDVQVVSMAQVRSTILRLVSSAKTIVLSVALIAVIIAMFGVVNTILMSVFERYQEIGILKSMGAMPLDIFKMIWVETTILCATGGLTGVMLAAGLGKLTEIAVRHFLPFAPHGSLVDIDYKVAGIAFLIITVSGIVSGFYPAWRAARVRPLDAIRSEML